MLESFAKLCIIVNYRHGQIDFICTLIAALTEPWLIISNRTMIQRLHWRDGAQLPMPYKINSNIAITAIGFHYSNQSICWVSIDGDMHINMYEYFFSYTYIMLHLLMLELRYS